MFRKNCLVAVIPSILLVSGCGGSDSDSQPINANTSQFIDSAVQGLGYDCGSINGTTNENGDFSFEDGQECEFFLNNLSLGTATPAVGEVITPYDVARDANEAVKIASLLQSIDADGNPDNGINTEGFEEYLPSELLEMSDTDFMNELEKVVENPVPLSDAKKHLDSNVPTEKKKGYHSTALQAVIDDIKIILPTIEQENYESKLSEYKAILNQGDDSNNSDIDVLLSLIELAEILNHQHVKNRIFFDYQQGSHYSEMLPEAIDYAINGTPNLIINKGIESSIGSTDADAELLFELSERLVSLSNKLAFSFTEESRVAEYDKSTSYQLAYNEAHAIRIVALMSANVLSTAAAYQYGSDELYLIIPEKIDAPIIVETYKHNPTDFDLHSFIEQTISVNSEYSLTEAFPKESFENDTNIYTYRKEGNESKYLSLALRSLKEAISVANNVVDLDKLNQEYGGLIDEEDLTAIKVELSKLDAHLKGEAETYNYVFESLNAQLNLVNFYDVEIGLDRSDMINIENNYEFPIDESLSKLINRPARAYPYDNEMEWYNGYWLYSEAIEVEPPYDYGHENYWLAAQQVNHELSFDWGSDLDKILISCYQEGKPCEL